MHTSRKTSNLYVLLGFLIYMFACQLPMEKLKIDHRIWGQDAKGQNVILYTLQNSQGMKVGVMNFGGIITSIEVPDREGNMEDIALGFDSLAPYLGKHPAFGATIGRYANRIGNAQFTLDGKVYELEKNAGANHIHGGSKAFHKVLWQSEVINDPHRVGVRLSLISDEGEAGFPGKVEVMAEFTLNDENELHIAFQASTDKATPINMTNHSYFNLNGCKENIYDHQIRIVADSATAVDEALIPTGKIIPLENTPLDLRDFTRIGDRILDVGKGFDHNYVLNNYSGALQKVAEVYDPNSGRVMEVLTSQPGVQFYTANYLNEKHIGKNGLAYKNHMGFCLETQHFPDSPNHEHFPSTIVRPGKPYMEEVVYRFSVR